MSGAAAPRVRGGAWSSLAAQLRIAARSLGTHKLRAALTVVSIFIGASSIVLMTSLANSGLSTIAHDIEDLGGARLLLVTPKEPKDDKQAKTKNGPGYLTRGDRAALSASLPYTAERSWYAQLEEQAVVADNGVDVVTDLIAGDTGFLPIFHMELERGRAFTDDEAKSARKVCVIGGGLARELWGTGKEKDKDSTAVVDVVGRRLTVGTLTCTVIGQTKKLGRVGMSFGFDWERFVLVPLPTQASIDSSIERQAILQVKSDAVAHNDIIKRIAAAILVERHHGADDFEVWDFSSVLAQFQQVFLILKLIVFFVASISLLVGGVGVMNMMLVSVRERVREIGIRKALGASPAVIARQFLVEAMLLTVIGGCAGVGFAVVLNAAVNVLIHQAEPAWVATTSVPAVVLALFASLLVGLGFGVLPARRAARLDVVEALRA